MNFLLDMGISPSIVDVLNRGGHEAVHVLDIGLGQADDSSYSEGMSTAQGGRDHDGQGPRQYRRNDGQYIPFRHYAPVRESLRPRTRSGSDGLPWRISPTGHRVLAYCSASRKVPISTPAGLGRRKSPARSRLHALKTPPRIIGRVRFLAKARCHSIPSSLDMTSARTRQARSKA